MLKLKKKETDLLETEEFVESVDGWFSSLDFIDDRSG